MRKLLLILAVLPFVVSCKHNKITSPTTTTEKEFNADAYYRCLYYAEGAHGDEFVRIHDTHTEFYRRLINLIVNNGKNLSFDAEMMIISIIKNKRDDMSKRAGKDIDKYLSARTGCDRQHGLN